MIPALRLALGGALLLLSGVAANAVDATSVPDGNTATFVDERKKEPGALDISTVVVSNDDTGRLTFRVNTPGRQRLTKDMRVRIWLSVRGQEYFLLVDPYKPPGATVGLYRVQPDPSGVAVGFMISAPSLTFRYARGARFGFDASEVGIDPSVDKRVAITFYTLIYAGVRFTPGTGYDFAELRLDRAPSPHPRTWRYIAFFGP